MTVTPTERRAKLSDAVAEEIRAVMGRQRVSGAELARRLHVSPMWVSYRLAGRQEIGLNDLQQIAAALGVGVAALLPENAATVVQTGTGATAVYRRRPEKAARAGRTPADTRPAGHPRAGGLRRPQLIGGLMDRMIGLVSPPGIPAVA